MDLRLIRAMNKYDMYHRINDCYQHGEGLLVQKLLKCIDFKFSFICLLSGHCVYIVVIIIDIRD